MFTGLSGLQANARGLDIAGNNIANVNTTAFKSSRALFANQFSRNLRMGLPPDDVNGGTNPYQVGLGVSVMGTQRNFNGGSISATGRPTDLAISGNGLFVVDRAGTNLYTRAGAFTRNPANQLVTPSGERLLGYGVDRNFQVDTAVLAPLNIPIGQLRIAQATSNVQFNGNLNTDGTVAASGARFELTALTDTTGPFGTDAVLPTSLLTNVTVGGQALAVVGDTVRIGDAAQSARVGARDIVPAQLEVTATTTVQDYLNFVRDALAINPGAGANPDGATPGVTLNVATGVVTVTGHTGTNSNITLNASAITVRPAAGADRAPFVPTRITSASGESVRTSVTVFDSLGSPVRVEVTMTLVAKTPGVGSTWRYDIESPDDAADSPFLSSGTVRFDGNGLLVSDPAIAVNIDRTGSGATTPLSFNLLMRSGQASVTALADTRPSTFAYRDQDGTRQGTLSDFDIGADGRIVGIFDNGQTRTLGQVVVASFANYEGLVDAGQNLWTVGANAGPPVISEPGTFGTGQITSGSLELANVDLSQEFINLILASTGYSASSRVISTTDQLLQQLLVIGR
jgi:flagellar hook protein FlgE